MIVGIRMRHKAIEGTTPVDGVLITTHTELASKIEVISHKTIHIGETTPSSHMEIEAITIASSAEGMEIIVISNKTYLHMIIRMVLLVVNHSQTKETSEEDRVVPQDMAMQTLQMSEMLEIRAYRERLQKSKWCFHDDDKLIPK
jgi:glucosamine 6-phosphate synthetase-like amidotransferase/phosphosugar isomerase protein